MQLSFAKNSEATEERGREAGLRSGSQKAGLVTHLEISRLYSNASKSPPTLDGTEIIDHLTTRVVLMPSVYVALSLAVHRGFFYLKEVVEMTLVILMLHTQAGL